MIKRTIPGLGGPISGPRRPILGLRGPKSYLNLIEKYIFSEGEQSPLIICYVHGIANYKAEVELNNTHSQSQVSQLHLTEI